MKRKHIVWVGLVICVLVRVSFGGGPPSWWDALGLMIGGSLGWWWFIRPDRSIDQAGLHKPGANQELVTIVSQKMSREMDPARPVTRNRVLAFAGAVVIWLALIVVDAQSEYISGFFYLGLAVYLARSIAGIGHTRAICDSDDEIRRKIDANNLRKNHS